MKKYILIFLGICAFSINSKAQDGFEGYLLAGDADRSKLIEAYINPAMKGLIFGMNGGWYHTAKVHKKFGFDISIGFNASLIPEKDEIFSLSGLKTVNTSSGGTLVGAATVGGSENITQQASVLISENVNGTPINYTRNFTTPGGIKEDLPISAIPAPAVQFNLGLPGKFEVSLRYLPKVGSDDVKAGLFGFGVKKEITSWFGPMEKTPLHVAVMATYTTMNADYTINGSGDVNVNNGLAAFKLNAYTFQALASLNFPIINIYGGFGYGTGNSTLTMTGNYTLNYDGGLQRTVKDPLNTEFSAGSFRTTAGIRLSLGFFKIFADYTLQEYNTINAGIAFSIR